MVGYFRRVNSYQTANHLGKSKLSIWHFLPTINTGNPHPLVQFSVILPKCHSATINDCMYMYIVIATRYWISRVQIRLLQFTYLELWYIIIRKSLDKFKWALHMQDFTLHRSNNCCTIQKADVPCSLLDRKSIMVIYSSDSINKYFWQAVWGP